MNIIVLLSQYSALAVVSEAPPVAAPALGLENNQTFFTLEDGTTLLDLEGA